MKIKNEKILILYNSVPYFLNYFEREGVNASIVFKKINFPLRVIRKITKWLHLPQSYWFCKWKNNIKSVDTVIIFAPLRELEVLKFLRNQNKNIKIIYWYWNPVFRFGTINQEIINYTELWSFDRDDCIKFGMKFNTTFYFKNITLQKNQILFDTVFVGIDKGRGFYLRSLQHMMENKGLKTHFHIVADPNNKTKNSMEKISYEEYLELLSKSKTIIDIVPEGQSGLTLRPMESIFLQKKLITTDRTISVHDFYNQNNIFIIGKDNDSSLLEFINTPFIPISSTILEKYDLSGWLKRFNNNEGFS